MRPQSDAGPVIPLRRHLRACGPRTLAPPHAVALELPPEMQPELAWAAGCWPGPVVSIGTTTGRRAAATTLPLVPEDSILEAFRLVTARDTPVAFVDRYVHSTRKELLH
jgi:hypothetical protein